MSLTPEQKIQPEKITKPFQLLAAWLVGLILVNGSLLSAAVLLKEPAWLAPMLSIAAIVNVPIFLIAIFLLQTKFRPQMQEDPFYSKYLENQNTKGPQTNPTEEFAQVRLQITDSQKRTLEIIKSVQDQIESLKNEVVTISEKTGHTEESEKRIMNLEALLKQSAKNIEVVERKMDWSAYDISLNDLLPEFQKIQTALFSNGIPVSRFFGTTSNKSEKPKIFVLGLGLGVPINEIQQLINILRPLGLSAINFTIGEGESRNIYIGSYIYNMIQVTKLEQNIVDAIFKAKRTEDLTGLISSYSY